MINLQMIVLLVATVPVSAQARYYQGGDGSMLPDPRYTPGVSVTQDAKVVCKKGYAGGVRNVSEATKKQVYREYGVIELPGKYEVDHLISLELGGSNDIKNLWPQPYKPAPGAHEKDKLEDHLHTEVCAGRITLVQAQHLISTNWYISWKEVSK